MKTHNPIHIRIEYSEAIESKKNLLTSIANMINLTKTINNYKKLRTKEIGIKIKLKRKLKETLTSIRKLQKHLPIPKIPSILKHENETIFEEKIISSQKNKINIPKNSLDYELQQIQNKLKSLGE